MLAGSVAPSQTSFFGLTLYGDFLTPGSFQTWSLFTSGLPGCDGVGEAELAIPIPVDPTLVGFSTYWQAFVMDPGSLRIGVSHTGGLEVRVVQ